MSFDHSHSENVLSPREALHFHGNMTLSEYVELLDSLGLDKVRLPEMTHEQIVAEHLNYIGPLTQKAAALLYDNWRLSSTIGRIKKTLAKEGSYTIHTERLPTKRGGKYARYSWAEANSNKGDDNDVAPV